MSGKEKQREEMPFEEGMDPGLRAVIDEAALPTPADGVDGPAALEDGKRPEKGSKALRASGAAPDPEPAPDKKEFLEAPYSFGMAENEAVVLNNGTLSLTVTDFVLPGRNGFDLAITRRYRSDSANLAEVSPTHDGYGVFGTSSRPNSQNIRNYGLGFGWYFVLPSIEEVPQSQRRPNITYTPFLHLEDGRSFSFSGNTLEEHPLKDVEIEQAAGTLTHPQKTSETKSYDITVRYKNGNKDYFRKKMAGGAADGYTLVARGDRFGNLQTFTLADYGGMTVVDSWGRGIVLAKQGESLRWTLPSGSSVRYRVTGGVSAMRLDSVRDQAGRVTRYTYCDPGEYKAQCKFASAAHGDGSSVQFSYMLLERILHPTGAETRYEYGAGQPGSAAVPLEVKTKPYDGFKRYFPLRGRRDIMDGGEYNTGSYQYTVNAGGYISHADVSLLNGVAEQHTFNDKGQLTHREVRHGGALMLSGAYTYGENSAKEDFKLLVAQTDKTYDPGDESVFMQKDTHWTYTADKKADIERVTETFPGEPDLDTETSMQYGAFSLLTRREYRKDANSLISERYTPDEDQGGKVMERREVCENGALKEKTRYLYGDTDNDRYCVVEERRYCDLGADTEAFRAAQSSYQSAKYTHAPVSVRQTGILDAGGVPLDDIVRQFDYDACGRATAETDALGHTTHTQYDALGRVVKVTYPAVDGVTHVKATRYDDAANVIVSTDENGVKTRYEYTPLGHIRRVVLAVSNIPHADDAVQAEYTYDTGGRVTAEAAYGQAPGGGIAPRTVTEYAYDGFDRVLDKTVRLPDESAGAVPDEAVLYRETHVYDDVVCSSAAGAVRKVSAHYKTVKGEGPGSGAPDVTTGACADRLGRTLWEELAGDVTARYEYDKLGNTLARTDARGNTTRYTCDYAGRQLSAAYTVGNQTRQSRVRYDELGNKVESRDCAGRVTIFTYDAAGRLLRLQSPFDERTAETRYGYDGAGNLLTQAVWQGEYWRETAYAYDARGRQTRATLYQNGERTQYSRTEYTYDGAGNKLETRTGITESTDAYAAVRYTYGRFGNVLSVTDALGQAERYAYDALGRLLRKTDRNGAVTVYTHDPLGRLTVEQVTVPTHRGNLLTRRTAAYYPNGGKKSEAVSEGPEGGGAPTLTVEYAYNSKGQPVSQREYTDSETPNGGTRKTVEYDACGNRRRFILARWGRIEIELWYVYDEANRLTALYRGGPDGEALAEYAYDANGNRILLRYPQNGAETRYGYNFANLVVSLENRLGGASLGEYRCAYSPDGNQVSKTSGARHTAYEYDRLGRLVREDDTGWNAVTYAYDRFSNRSEMAALGHEGAGGSADDYTTVYAYDLNNRLLTETKEDRAGQATEVYFYSYDANGAQTRRVLRRTEKRKPTTPRGRVGFVTGEEPRGAVTLDTRVYNGFGQLVWVSRDALRCEYQYRPDGLRAAQTVWNSLKKQKRAVLFQWDGQNMVLEENAQSRQVKARYLRGANLVCQVVDLSLMFYFFNAHGDVTRLADSFANRSPVYEYDAFGSTRDPKGRVTPAGQANDGLDTDPNPFRYCGEYFDSACNEYYLRARTYQPGNGRFASEDPARNEQNWYIYGDNNPVTWIDPSGEIPTWAKWAIGAAVIVGLVAASIATGGAAAVFAATSAGVVFSSTAAAATTLGAVGAITAAGASTAVAGVIAAALGRDDVGDVMADAFMWGAFAGGASGALGGTALGLAGQVVGNAVISFGAYAGSTISNGNEITILGSLISTGGGALGGRLGGPGYFSSEATYGRMLASGGRFSLLYLADKPLLTLSEVGARAVKQGMVGIVRGAAVGSAVSGLAGLVPSTSTDSSAAKPPASKPAGSGANYTPSAPSPTSSGRYVYYTVRPGESPWSIAAKVLGDGTRYREIQALTRWGGVDPGQRLRIAV